MEDLSNFYALSWFFFIMGVSSWAVTFAYCVTRNYEHPYRDWLAWGIAFVVGATFIGLSKYYKMRYKLEPPHKVHRCMGLEIYDRGRECLEEYRRYDDE